MAAVKQQENVGFRVKVGSWECLQAATTREPVP